jgi:calcineurin-like phosphoesterase family protein
MPLHGLKRLVLGNHDHYPLAIYQQYFSKIYGAAEFAGCILTQVPVHPARLETRYKRNLHGHMHSKRLPDIRYVCVSVEHTGLAPMLLDTAINCGLPIQVD